MAAFGNLRQLIPEGNVGMFKLLWIEHICNAV
jgi:hypothetical protein